MSPIAFRCTGKVRANLQSRRWTPAVAANRQEAEAILKEVAWILRLTQTIKDSMIGRPPQSVCEN